MLHYEYHIDTLRKAFEYYLLMKYPKATSVTRRTKVQDAFAPFVWMPEREAWEFVLLDPAQLDQKRDFLVDEFLFHRKNPGKDARGYIRAIKELHSFLVLIGLVEQSIQRKPRKIEPSNSQL